MVGVFLKRFISAAFALFWLAPGGHVTQTFFEDVPLNDLVRHATVIVLAQKRNPPVTHQTVPVLPPEGKTVQGEIPPFTKTTYHFTVVDVLKSDQPLPPGLSLDVSPANEEDNLFIHKAYYIDRIGKSPIYDSYAPSIDFEKSDTLLLFLSTGDHRSYRFSVENAFEAPAKRKQVERLIQGK